MGRRKKKSKLLTADCTGPSHYKPNKDIPNLPKPRYLVLSRDHPEETMTNVPLSLLSNVINNVAGKVQSIKRLKSGLVLIETKTETQSAKLLKLKYFPPRVPVRVTAHRWLNYSRGVVKCWGLGSVSLEEMKQELRSQFVVDIQPIMSKSVGKDGTCPLERTSSYILTFALPTLPEIVYIGVYILSPTPYVPQPKLCYRCYQYGHISKYCKMEKELCRKCIQPGHDSVSCSSSTVCANCSENCQTGHVPCLGYMVHRKIMEIESILKNVNLDN